jgi:hypothetical protein
MPACRSRRSGRARLARTSTAADRSCANLPAAPARRPALPNTATTCFNVSSGVSDLTNAPIRGSSRILISELGKRGTSGSTSTQRWQARVPCLPICTEVSEAGCRQGCPRAAIISVTNCGRALIGSVAERPPRRRTADAPHLHPNGPERGSTCMYGRAAVGVGPISLQKILSNENANAGRHPPVDRNSAASGEALSLKACEGDGLRRRCAKGGSSVREDHSQQILMKQTSPIY